MIQIHRSEPRVKVGKKSVNLTPGEHLLMVSLGMMDNKIVPYELLIDIMTEGRAATHDEMKTLFLKISRIRRKTGACITTRTKLGYMLEGDVQFFGVGSAS